jgi:hypothetical protein
VNSFGRLVAAMVGWPWLVAARNAGLDAAVCWCCSWSGVAATCCWCANVACCAVGRAATPPVPPLKATRLVEVPL